MEPIMTAPRFWSQECNNQLQLPKIHLGQILLIISLLLLPIMVIRPKLFLQLSAMFLFWLPACLG